MKNEDLKSILANESLDEAQKLAKIQELNGLDRQAEIDKKNTEIGTLQAQFENDKKAWEEEKKKYSGMVSQEAYDKAMADLNAFKQAKEEGNRASYLKSQLKVKEGYETLISGQIDWSKAEYDESAKSYKGDDFLKQVEAVKGRFPELFTGAEKKLPDKGYFTPPVDTSDLTKL